MKKSTRFGGNRRWVHALLFALVLIAGTAIYPLTALQTTQQAPTAYIQGTVRSATGPEAGVWVIAETKDLPTGFIKIVVDQWNIEGRAGLAGVEGQRTARRGVIGAGDCRAITGGVRHSHRLAGRIAQQNGDDRRAAVLW